VEQPRALGWIPRSDVLLVVARDGGVHQVEPSFGTRLLFTAAPDAAQVAVSRELLALVTREGLLQVWTHDGTLRWERASGLLAGLHLQWWRGGLALAGEDLRDRRVIVYDENGEPRTRARIPVRAALGTDPDGGLLLARSTESGLSIRPFGEPFPPARSTLHQLRFAADGAVLGIATGGVTVWHGGDEAPVNVKLFDVVNVALTPDQSLVAIGTRIGGVALGSARAGTGQRVNPSRVDGHDAAVIALAFSPRGRWLASAAGRCWVWSY
jgi:hypothetical protein